MQFGAGCIDPLQAQALAKISSAKLVAVTVATLHATWSEWVEKRQITLSHRGT